MTLRDPRLLLAPDSDEEAIPVSPRKLADLIREKLEHERRLREAEEEIRRIEKENERLRREIERLRPALEKTRKKLEGLQGSLAVLGTDARTAAAVGVPSSKVFFRASPPPHEPRRRPGGQPGHPGVTRPRLTPNAPPRVLVRSQLAGRTDGGPGAPVIGAPSFARAKSQNR